VIKRGEPLTNHRKATVAKEIGMSDKGTTLKERFDAHMGQAEFSEGQSIKLLMAEMPEQGKIFLQRAQLHATLALAIAQRMTAEATGKMNEAVQQKKTWDI